MAKDALEWPVLVGECRGQLRDRVLDDAVSGLHRGVDDPPPLLTEAVDGLRDLVQIAVVVHPGEDLATELERVPGDARALFGLRLAQDPMEGPVRERQAGDLTAHTVVFIGRGREEPTLANEDLRNVSTAGPRRRQRRRPFDARRVDGPVAQRT